MPSYGKVQCSVIFIFIFISHFHYSTEDKRNILEFVRQLNTGKLGLLLNCICSEQNLKMSHDASPIIPKNKRALDKNN